MARKAERADKKMLKKRDKIHFFLYNGIHWTSTCKENCPIADNMYRDFYFPKRV